MNIKNENVIQKVFDILGTSTRPMPAVFTSNGKKTKSFCIDFEIDPNDEYNMASEAWSKCPDQLAIKAGEDIMLGCYILVKIGEIHKLEELKKIVIQAEKPSYLQSTDSNLKVIEDYCNYCASYGTDLAVGKPLTIPKR